MKKLLCLCAAFALFAAVGCDDKKTTANTGGGKGSASASPEAKPAAK